MANGKHGDHPLTDILNHDLPVFTPKIDKLIKEISLYVSFHKFCDMFDWFSLPPNTEFEKQLSEKLDEFQKDAQDRGWEPKT